jgi:hypothetical protein
MKEQEQISSMEKPKLHGKYWSPPEPPWSNWSTRNAIEAFESSWRKWNTRSAMEQLEHNISILEQLENRSTCSNWSIESY